MSLLNVSIQPLTNNILDILTNKRILILENSECLDDCIDNFYKFLKYHKVPVKILYDLSNLSFDNIAECIKLADVILFETTGKTETYKKLVPYMISLQDKKTIIETYIDKPRFMRLPEGVIHDFYIIASDDYDVKYWTLHKLYVDKMYWE